MGITSTQTQFVCADDYGCDGLDCTTCPYTRPAKWASVALCDSRHPTPAINGSIFPSEVDPTDVAGLTRHAVQTIRESGVEFLTVYVTGLTVALVAVINACHMLNVGLTLKHYDRNLGDYYAQIVR